ncbi:hypothetical protein RF11_01917 [Thelohanellus kitauei]|uniref:FLYWCH-type domain-containing protein n=1 Tax=Thelohanellus kitauei TaxID=669202 RepID=A0A0C2MHT3_THEKT|nr:hypothetical protein RF11_01917 [Thelohanellus kitauei]
MSKPICCDGFIYHANGTKSGTKYFRCKNYKIENCKARLISKSEGKYILKGSHEFSKQIDLLATPETLIENYVSELAIDLRKYPYQIYQDMLKYITENPSSVVKIPSKNGVNNIIKRVRGMTNTDISAIEAESHSNTSSGMQFLRRTGFGT